MWVIVVVLIIGLLALYLLKEKSGRAITFNKSTAKIIDLPNKVLNPSEFVALPNIIAWEFQVPNLSTACEYARQHASMRKQAHECEVLPISRCNTQTCICFYRPVYESRKQQRRQNSDRRDSIRFEEGHERRHAADRRKDQPDWHDKFIK
jgi:hypothetical protein